MTAEFSSSLADAAFKSAVKFLEDYLHVSGGMATRETAERELAVWAFALTAEDHGRCLAEFEARGLIPRSGTVVPFPHRLK